MHRQPCCVCSVNLAVYILCRVNLAVYAAITYCCGVNLLLWRQHSAVYNAHAVLTLCCGVKQLTWQNGGQPKRCNSASTERTFERCDVFYQLHHVRAHQSDPSRDHKARLWNMLGAAHVALGFGQVSVCSSNVLFSMLMLSHNTLLLPPFLARRSLVCDSRTFMNSGLAAAA